VGGYEQVDGVDSDEETAGRIEDRRLTYRRV